MQPGDLKKIYDCIIIGGGPAGLSATLSLVRARREVLIFDDCNPRNKPTQEMHGFISRDGIAPEEFRRIVLKDISKYGTSSRIEERVISVENEGKIFKLVTSSGNSYISKTIVLATGLRDIFPKIEGLHNFFGKSIFSCPFCDGWELRDRKIVAISETPMGWKLARLASNWSQDVTLCTNGNEIEEKDKRAFESKGVKVITSKIVKLVGSDDGILQSIQIEDGSEILAEGGFVMTGFEQSSSFPRDLGCEMGPNGNVVVDILGRTSVKGVYAAGEMTSMPSQVIICASEGSRVGSAITYDMMEEKFSESL